MTPAWAVCRSLPFTASRVRKRVRSRISRRDWLAMMGYTVDEAQRLGMGVDMSLGSGWCFGGPTVSREDANASVVVKTFFLGAGENLSGKFDRKTTQALVAFSAGREIN